MGLLQTFDASLGLAPTEQRTLPDAIYDGFEIKSIEVEQVYAAGGSKATVELIYTEDVDPGTVSLLAERDHQPDMEIRVTQSSYQPESETVETPDSVKDFYNADDLVDRDFRDQFPAENLEEVFGPLDAIDNVLTPVQRVAQQTGVAGSLDEIDIPQSLTGAVETATEFEGQEQTVQQKRPLGVTQTIFTGKPIRVIGKKEGVLELTLLDNRLLLNRNYVRLDTTQAANPGENNPRQGTPIKPVIEDLITNEEPFEQFTLFTEQEYQSLISENNGESPRDYKAVVISQKIVTQKIKANYGDNEPMTLYRVLSDIAARGAIHFFIDKFNNLRFNIYPSKKAYVPGFVTNVEAGNEEDPSNVLVNSPFDDTGVNLFGPTSSKDVASNVEFPDVSGKRKLQQTNVVSASEADAYALDTYMTDLASRNYGTITVLGDPVLSIYDEILLAVLPDLTPIQNGVYTSKVVRHKINGTDGFVTEIELGESTQQMYHKIQGASKKAQKRSQNIKDGTGPLDKVIHSFPSEGIKNVLDRDIPLNPRLALQGGPDN